MRLDPDSKNPSAQDIVNDWSEVDLGKIIREYGEEKNWKAVASR